MKLEFCRQIFYRKVRISDAIKIQPGEAEFSMRAYGRTEGRMDRRTDMKKLTVAFCNFANAPKIREVLNY
jgi:hypothetical protein